MMRDILSDTLEMDFCPTGLCNLPCLEKIIKTARDYQLLIIVDFITLIFIRWANLNSSLSQVVRGHFEKTAQEENESLERR